MEQLDALELRLHADSDMDALWGEMRTKDLKFCMAGKMLTLKDRVTAELQTFHIKKIYEIKTADGPTIKALQLRDLNQSLVKQTP
jgi:hypothetical protein